MLNPFAHCVWGNNFPLPETRDDVALEILHLLLTFADPGDLSYFFSSSLVQFSASFCHEKYRSSSVLRFNFLKPLNKSDNFKVFRYCMHAQIRNPRTHLRTCINSQNSMGAYHQSILWAPLFVFTLGPPNWPCHHSSTDPFCGTVY